MNVCGLHTRLLHDDTLQTGDRVGGLLLLLYAQRIATISQLTVDHVDLGDDGVTITFGSTPVVLPSHWPTSSASS